MTCFFLLSILASITWILDINMSIEICRNLGISVHGCEHCVDKLIILGAYLCAGFAFYYGAKRTMRNFLLILLGTYNHCINARTHMMIPIKIIKIVSEFIINYHIIEC